MKTIAVILIALSLCFGQSMVVHGTTGTQAFDLSTIDSITFELLPPIPTDSLVAYYPFSGNANDLSGNGNNGTVTGATLTSDRKGNASSAYYFNGISDFINCGNSSSLHITGKVTVAAWVKVDSTSLSGIIAGKGQPCNNAGNYTLEYTGSAISFRYHDGVGVDKIAQAPQTLNKVWTFVAMTYNYSTFTLNIYVNGQLIANSWIVAPVGTTPTTTLNSLSIGAWMVYSNNASCSGKAVGSPLSLFKGSIDDVRVYKRILTADEIKALYYE